ncbi:hypothetical protein [Nitrospira sp. Nam74]
MPDVHGSAEKPTFGGQNKAVCGGFRRNGDKDYGFPARCWLGRRLEEQLPPLAFLDKGSLRPK